MDTVLSSLDENIDPANYEKQEKLYFYKNKDWKYFNIMNIANGSKNLLKISNDFYENFSRVRSISFYREVDISSKLNHPAILKLLGYSLTNFKCKPKPILIFENPSKQSKFYHFFDKKEYSYDDYSYTVTTFSDTQKLIAIFAFK